MKPNKTLFKNAKTNAFALYLADEEVLLSEEGRELVRSLFGDRTACVYCGVLPPCGQRLTCDHIVATARGGCDRVWNRVTACEACNKQKNDRPVEEFAAPEVVQRLSLYIERMHDLVEAAFAEAEESLK